MKHMFVCVKSPEYWYFQIKHDSSDPEIGQTVSFPVENIRPVAQPSEENYDEGKLIDLKFFFGCCSGGL